MALHLFSVTSGSAMPSSASEKDRNELRLLCAYENGGVTLWRYATPEKQVSIEGIGWENAWTVKLHSDTSKCSAPALKLFPPSIELHAVMSMAVSTDNTLALTVSADHLVGRYALNVST
jgi:ASTRA-associated protein 1